MTKELIQEYTNRIANANASQIIVIVYEIADVYLSDALIALEAGDKEEFAANLRKASKCVKDLTEALDMNYDISRSLLDIYMYVNRELSLAAIRLDAEMVVTLKDMLLRLKESFEKVSDEDKSGAVMSNAQEVYAGLTYGKGTLNEATVSQNNRGYTV